MKPFDQVARATRINRWRRLGETTLHQYNIKDAKLRFVSDTAFVVFRVDTPSQRYVLRIDPELADDRWLPMLKAEICWLSALRRDTALAVPEPITAQDGTSVQVVSVEGIPGPHLVTLLRWMPGRLIGNHPTRKIMAQVGAFMAHLHCHAEHFVLPDGASRPHTEWGKLSYWQDPRNDTSATLTAQQRDLCATASERLLADIEQFGRDSDYGLIHADLHLGNCLLYDGTLQVIDFGDCHFASYFYDIAVPLTFLTEHPDLEALRASLYDGYTRVRSLPDHAEAAVQTFTVARAFDLIEWIHLDWPSPTYRPWGPQLLDSSIQQIRDYQSNSA
jgi:Ser/Thr protein kinase RdoA (MazF antagonist)